MMTQIRKYAPFAALAGYIMVYTSKGYDRILVDLKGITPDKLMAKWQNFLIAAIAYGAMMVIKKIKMPAALKTVITVLLWGVIGYQVATAIDPPNGGSINYVSNNARNPYALGRR